MNKRIFTLCASAMLVASSFSAMAQAPVEGPTEASTVVEGDYYFLGDMVGDAYLTIDQGAGTDSLVYRSNVGALTVDSLNAMWTATKGVTNYTFMNVGTGKTLSLDMKGNSILKADMGDEFGWNYDLPGQAYLTYISGGTTYTLNGTPNVDDLALTTGTTIPYAIIKPINPGWTKMTADALNAETGNGFALILDQTDYSTTDKSQASLASVNGTFEAVDIVDGNPLAAGATEYALRKVGAKVNTQEMYLTVDTIYYEKRSLIDSTMTNGGLTIGLDSIMNPAYTATHTNPVRAKRAAKFTVWKNVKDSIIIEVNNVPAIAANLAANTFANNLVRITVADPNARAFLSIAGFDEGSKVLTASTEMPTTANMPVFGRKASTNVELAAGAYFIYKNKANVADSAYVAELNNALTIEPIKVVANGEESLLVPATQWSLLTTGKAGAFINRESGNMIPGFGPSTKFYHSEDMVENQYAYGADTLFIVPITTEGIYVGYKKFGKTAAAEKITKVALAFHTSIAPSVMPYMAKKSATDSFMIVNSEVETPMTFNVMPVDTFDIGADSLKAVSYKLFQVSGNDTMYLAKDVAKYKMTSTANSSNFLFRSTNVANRYQMLDYSIIGGVATWTLDGQVSVASSTADVIENTDLTDLDGFWSIENTTAPEYQDLASGFYKFSSVMNPSLAIASSDSASNYVGMLVSINDNMGGIDTTSNFNLFVAKMDSDEVRPTFTISTQQKARVDSTNSLFLSNSGKDFIVDGSNLGDSVLFVEGLRFGANELRDSIAVMDSDAKLDTLTTAQAAPGIVALRKTATEDQFLIESNVDNGGITNLYLAQFNGVLFFQEDLGQALPFTVAKQAYMTAADEVAAPTQVVVVPTEGGVQVLNAAGKKVIVANLLGQVVANTILSSDNATIAAPAGMVVVAVEGEAAVKAIVK